MPSSQDLPGDRRRRHREARGGRFARVGGARRGRPPSPPSHAALEAEPRRLCGVDGGLDSRPGPRSELGSGPRAAGGGDDDTVRRRGGRARADRRHVQAAGGGQTTGAEAPPQRHERAGGVLNLPSHPVRQVVQPARSCGLLIGGVARAGRRGDAGRRGSQDVVDGRRRPRVRRARRGQPGLFDARRLHRQALRPRLRRHRQAPPGASAPARALPPLLRAVDRARRFRLGRRRRGGRRKARAPRVGRVRPPDGRRRDARRHRLGRCPQRRCAAADADEAHHLGARLRDPVHHHARRRVDDEAAHAPRVAARQRVRRAGPLQLPLSASAAHRGRLGARRRLRGDSQGRAPPDPDGGAVLPWRAEAPRKVRRALRRPCRADWRVALAWRRRRRCRALWRGAASSPHRPRRGRARGGRARDQRGGVRTRARCRPPRRQADGGRFPPRRHGVRQRAMLGQPLVHPRPPPGQ